MPKRNNRAFAPTSNLASSKFVSQYRNSTTRVDSRRVQHALEREAEFLAATGYNLLSDSLKHLSETLSVASLERIYKDVRNG